MTDEVTLGEVYRAVQNVREQMVTKAEYKAGQEAVAQRIASLEQSLSNERISRAEGDAAVRGDLDKTATRLQLVEDRLESRKYSVMIAIGLSIVGVVFSLFGNIIIRSIVGG